MPDAPTLEELAAVHVAQHLAWLAAHEAAQLTGRRAADLYNEAPGSGTIEAIRRGRAREYADHSPRELHTAQREATQRVLDHLLRTIADAKPLKKKTATARLADEFERYATYAERIAKEQGAKITIAGRGPSIVVHLVDLPTFERVEAYL